LALVTLQGLELDTSDPHGVTAIAQLRRDDGELRAAIRTLRKASRKFPDQGLVWNDLAELLVEAEDYEDAVRAARRATELLPDSGIPWGHLGDAWAGLGKRSRSRRCWEEALERAHPARERIQQKVEEARRERKQFSGGWRGFLQRETKKFWAIQVKGSDNVIRSGRVGKKGRKTIRTYASKAAAERGAEKLIQEQLADGYREVQRKG
jgi:predicted DNA-binding WGR domain protein